MPGLEPNNRHDLQTEGYNQMCNILGLGGDENKIVGQESSNKMHTADM